MKHELEMLRELRKNARIKISKISRILLVALQPLYSCLEKLDNNIIKKNTTLVNFEKMGYKRFFIIIHTENIDLLDALFRKEYVNNYFRTNKGAIIEAVFLSNSQIENIKNSLSMKRINYSVHPLLEIKKQEEAII